MPSSYRLNPFEQSSLQTLAQGLANGLDPQFAYGLYDQTIQGATQRRAANLDARSQGISGLQDLAMQLAQSGVDPGTVTNLVSGRANDLPLMGGKNGQEMLGNLQGDIQGWYPDGTGVSTLVPPDQRQALLDQMNSYGQLDDADKGAVGNLVVQGLQSGTPFKDIREAVRQQAIAAGQDPEAFVAHAEDAYQQITGQSLGSMRSAADQYRTYGNAEQQAYDQLSGQGVNPGWVPNAVDPQQLFANVAAQDPSSLGDMVKFVGGTGSILQGTRPGNDINGGLNQILSDLMQGVYDKYAPQQPAAG